MMRRMLSPSAGEAVLDLGCGAGKMALYASASGARAAGIDLAPFFLARAKGTVELVLGDLRRLPFRRGAYPCAYSLDVLEHLDEPGVVDVLREARRAVGPAGACSSTRTRWSRRASRRSSAGQPAGEALGRAGLIDHEREAMRKSDHRNAIRSHEHFDALCARGRPRVVERRYYNVVVKAVVEDLFLRLYEQARRGKKAAPAHGHGHGHAEAAPGAAVAIEGKPPGRAGARHRPGADLVPEARRGALRRHPHRPVLRAAAPHRTRSGHAEGVRILYVACDQVVPGSTGGSVHVLEVARGLAARGHELHVAVSARSGAPPDLPGVRWHRVSWTPPSRFFRFRAQGAVEALLRETRAQAVMERYYNFGGEGVGAAAAVACRRCSR
jgi:SAM-dependent methyltransferase